MKGINQEAQKAKLEFWDNFAPVYETTAEMETIQGTTTCAVMTSMMHKKRSIEVGCGPGRHSLMLASTFLRKDGGVLVSCDFSNWMVQKLAQNYKEGDYSKVPGNKSLIDLKNEAMYDID